jgi:hypothetical protein
MTRRNSRLRSSLDAGSRVQEPEYAAMMEEPSGPRRSGPALAHPAVVTNRNMKTRARKNLGRGMGDNSFLGKRRQLWRDPWPVSL